MELLHQFLVNQLHSLTVFSGFLKFLVHFLHLLVHLVDHRLLLIDLVEYGDRVELIKGGHSCCRVGSGFLVLKSCVTFRKA
jgi:hypothetical protein